MKPVNQMNYVEFISFLKETNRCPGGKETIRWILQNSFSTSESNVLEVGSNTGFSSLEVARTVHCKVLGIDPVPEAVEQARWELAKDTESIQELVRFEIGSAYDLACEDSSVDLIIAGGSTSFMDQKDRAIQEMERVLKPWGTLSVTNLFYHTQPPQALLDKVSETIGVTIEALSSEDWKSIYLQAGDLELYAFETAWLAPKSAEQIAEYVRYFMEKPHIKCLLASEQAAIAARWQTTLEIFNENHRYLGFIKALLRKRTSAEEPELFTVANEQADDCFRLVKIKRS